MSHTVHPYSHRLGILRDWKSRWFAGKGKYQEQLRADILIREYLEKHLRGKAVDSLVIERNANMMKILIKSARPGMIIGRSGEGAAHLRMNIEKFAKAKKVALPGNLKIDIEEVRFPETSAAIVGEMVAEGLEKRLPFRRVLKQTVEKVMANKDVQGVRIGIAGRLGGADMSRTEELKKGNIPLQTFRADIDFAREKAHLPYGVIGIKVWIYKGLIFEKKKQKTFAQ